MAGQDRENASEEVRREIKPSGTWFFIDNHLCKLITKNRGMNIAYLFDLIDQKEKTMLLSDFKKNKKRAYTVIDSSRILKIGKKQIERYVKAGLIPPPIGAVPGGARTFSKKSYYSEDHIFEIRDFLSTVHRGRPRKDGKITNSTLTEQELRANMGDALMLYTRTKDGEFIPVWSEQVY